MTRMRDPTERARPAGARLAAWPACPPPCAPPADARPAHRRAHQGRPRAGHHPVGPGRRGRGAVGATPRRSTCTWPTRSAAGAGLCDVDAVRVLVDEGPRRVEELIALGAEFDRDARGNLELAREGGHSVARVVHAGARPPAPRSNGPWSHAVRRTAAVVVTSTPSPSTCSSRTAAAPGCVALGPRRPAHEVRARNVLLATGGAGQLYAVTTNPPEATGDGVAMALRAGVAVADLEFFQFHPTALHHARHAPAAAVRGAAGPRRAAARRVRASASSTSSCPATWCPGPSWPGCSSRAPTTSGSTPPGSTTSTSRFPNIAADLAAGRPRPAPPTCCRWRPRRTTSAAASSPTSTAPPSLPGPVGRRRDHLHRRARRQPPRLQLAARGHGVRPPRGRGHRRRASTGPRPPAPCGPCSASPDGGPGGSDSLDIGGAVPLADAARRPERRRRRAPPPTAPRARCSRPCPPTPACCARPRAWTAARRGRRTLAGWPVGRRAWTDRGGGRAAQPGRSRPGRWWRAATARTESPGHPRPRRPPRHRPRPAATGWCVGGRSGRASTPRNDASAALTRAGSTRRSMPCATPSRRAAGRGPRPRWATSPRRCCRPAPGEARFVARRPVAWPAPRCATEAFAPGRPGGRACRGRSTRAPQLAAGRGARAWSGGRWRSILTGERTALNFLGHLSGIATLTAALRRGGGSAAATPGCGTPARPCPACASLAKAAVRAGGGRNHRGNLSDWMLIKDNHLGGIGITEAVAVARDRWPGRTVHVECDSLDQCIEALEAGRRRHPARQHDARRGPGLRGRGRGPPGRPAPAARCSRCPAASPSTPSAPTRRTGVDLISVGAITNSAPVLDLGLDLA